MSHWNHFDAANLATKRESRKKIIKARLANIAFRRNNVRSKNFKRWFGDWENDPKNASKVVDENGEPLVVYHGSNEYGFTVFDENKSTSNLNVGFHFGSKAAEERINGATENTGIYPAVSVGDDRIY